MDKLFDELNSDEEQDFQMLEFTNILQIYRNQLKLTENTTNEDSQSNESNQ